MDNQFYNSDRPNNVNTFSSDQANKIRKIDIKIYSKTIHHKKLCEQAEEDFIKSIWLILSAFVDLGFDLKPDKKESSIGEKACELIAIKSARK